MRQEKFSIRWRAARSLRCAGDGSGENDADPRNLRPFGCRRYGDQSHVRHNQRVQRPRSPSGLSFRLLPDQSDRGGVRFQDYEEYFYSGNLCLVEWPEKIEPVDACGGCHDCPDRRDGRRQPGAADRLDPRRECLEAVGRWYAVWMKSLKLNGDSDCLLFLG